MKEILVSKNRPCFCNSSKKFKDCCGKNVSKEAEDTHKIYFLLRDIYSKSYAFFKKNYDCEKYMKEFKIYNNIGENITVNFEHSFKFIEFILFKAINKETNKPLIDEIIKNPSLDNKERAFLNELLSSNSFSIFKLLKYDSKTGYLLIKDIFNNKEYDFYNKIFQNLEEGGFIFGNRYIIYSRNGLLPTINFKKKDEVKEEDLENSVRKIIKRFENEKENKSNLTLEKYMNSIEYEFFGGDDPYVEYEFDKKFEEFKKNNPGKNFDDFLDEIEHEMLELK